MNYIILYFPISYSYLTVVHPVHQRGRWKFLKNQWRLFSFMLFYVWIYVFVFSFQIHLAAITEDQYLAYDKYIGTLSRQIILFSVHILSLTFRTRLPIKSSCRIRYPSFD